MALSMQHCFHDLCMFRMSVSLLFKTYLAFGTLPTHLASRNARTAATAQRQPVNPRRQLQQRRVLGDKATYFVKPRCLHRRGAKSKENVTLWVVFLNGRAMGAQTRSVS